MKKDKKESLKPYFTWGLPLLGLMAVLLTISVVVTVLIYHFMS